MNVFIYEMRQNRRSIITWAATLAVAAFVLLSAAPMFIEESSSMRELLSSFPDEVKTAMGIDVGVFFSTVGFYSYLFLYLTLVAAIQAMSLGLGIISKESRMKTADFLLSKPYTRGKTYRQKLLAVLCALAITDAAFFTSATLSMIYQSDGGFSLQVFVLINLTYIFMQLVFLAIGLFLAAVVNKIKSTITVTMGVCFGAFMIGMISAAADSKALRYLSPLRYFDNNYIMTNNEYEVKYLIISIALVLVLTAASYIVYVKKDVKAVT